MENQPPELEERILTIPRVAEIEVSRVLPDKLFIYIQEKYPLVLALPWLLSRTCC